MNEGGASNWTPASSKTLSSLSLKANDSSIPLYFDSAAIEFIGTLSDNSVVYFNEDYEQINSSLKDAEGATWSDSGAFTYRSKLGSDTIPSNYIAADVSFVMTRTVNGAPSDLYFSSTHQQITPPIQLTVTSNSQSAPYQTKLGLFDSNFIQGQPKSLPLGTFYKTSSESANVLVSLPSNVTFEGVGIASVDKTLPDWFTLSEDQLKLKIATSKTTAQADVGTYKLLLTAKVTDSNSAPDAQVQFWVTFKVEDKNDKPVFNASTVSDYDTKLNNLTAFIGVDSNNSAKAFNFAFDLTQFTDADPSQSLTYKAKLVNTDDSLGDDLPATSWLKFDKNTGVFSGSPTSQDGESIKVRVIATDSAAGPLKLYEDSSDITIAIQENKAPTLVADTATQVVATIGKAISTTTNGNTTPGYDVSGFFTDEDTSDTLTYRAYIDTDEITGTSSGWLKFSGGKLTGTPPANAADTVVSLKAVDNDGFVSSTKSVDLKINNAPTITGLVDLEFYNDYELTDDKVISLSPYFADADTSQTPTYAATFGTNGTGFFDWKASTKELTIKKQIAKGDYAVTIVADDTFTTTTKVLNITIS